jgi:hypothetical protein
MNRMSFRHAQVREWASNLLAAGTLTLLVGRRPPKTAARVARRVAP